MVSACLDGLGHLYSKHGVWRKNALKCTLQTEGGWGVKSYLGNAKIEGAKFIKLPT